MTRKKQPKYTLYTVISALAIICLSPSVQASYGYECLLTLQTQSFTVDEGENTNGSPIVYGTFTILDAQLIGRRSQKCPIRMDTAHIISTRPFVAKHLSPHSARSITSKNVDIKTIKPGDIITTNHIFYSDMTLTGLVNSYRWNILSIK